VYEQLTARVDQMLSGFKAAADKHGVPFTYNKAGSMFGLFFTELDKVENFQQVANDCSGERFNQFFHGMLAEGVYLAPSSFEAGFMSLAHTEADIDATIAAADTVMASLAS